MTEQEIVRVFSGQVTKLEKTETWDRPQAYATIGIDDFQIEKELYGVRFLMDPSDKRLRSVVIRLKGDNHPGAEVIFRSLEQGLVEKYGIPSYKNDERRPEGSTTLKRMWKFPTTIIELSYLELRTIKLRVLGISYSDARRRGTAADKL